MIVAENGASSLEAIRKVRQSLIKPMQIKQRLAEIALYTERFRVIGTQPIKELFS